ncbi:NADH-quinone oxidoreductase subunit L [Jatrophihabitans lederbergiae]|uniref:NADH-quinone oxidoreductase subunit L n=1 Tax=Jatrophihabitans lederbergiae TaxID=3075547 RepID=A0ABU2J552_9ACTN|nr:NADH-quinone oxidoreductase subunit L [Jatrophihabitans sp. DSM 44399]MDT0260116.1 NADH-quinone oxidoreductase subunit L [Jatrophihabitans sp. DSM 44399]
MNAAHGIQSAAWLLVAVPALSAAVLLLFGKRADKWGHLLGALVPVLLFIYAAMLFFSIRGESGEGRERNLHLFSWIPVGGFDVDVGFLLDPLSLTFVLLITGVGSLIHIYAVGYMAHDPGRRRFFGYFNLFIAAMLLLVLANGYLVLYVGWEGVGLASYLLIGYYYTRPAAGTAAKKAFIANRVGDVGLSIAIMLMFVYVGSTDFQHVLYGGALNALKPGVILAISLMLLLGACGKSGQFPLQTWLPDAMEGPTPVSALIHAATMVTAGVYLIARSAPIFNLTQDGRTVVTVIGAITLLYGCVCAFGQDDLKKVLAYSTVSQIGYMFLAVGLGNGVYAIGILHLVGHGFFKAALFLSAGSVMHAMNDRIDMRRFGGLARVMPITYGVFVCGYLAIIGFPGATGFFTKDKIIEAAFDKGGTSGWILGIVALLGAALTAFYMTRALVMTFHGKRRWEDDVHPHEAPVTMKAPMIVLGLLALVGGFLLTFGGSLQNWLEPSVGKPIEAGAHTISSTVLTALTLVVVAFGVAGAVLAFGRRPVPVVQPAGSPITVAARRNIYADAFNETVLMRPGQWLVRGLVFFDNRGVDGAVNTFAAGLGGGSGRLRRTQTGFVRSYALSMLAGTAVILAVLLAVRFS